MCTKKSSFKPTWLHVHPMHLPWIRPRISPWYNSSAKHVWNIRVKVQRINPWSLLFYIDFYPWHKFKQFGFSSRESLIEDSKSGVISIGGLNRDVTTFYTSTRKWVANSPPSPPGTAVLGRMLLLYGNMIGKAEKADNAHVQYFQKLH